MRGLSLMIMMLCLGVFGLTPMTFAGTDNQKTTMQDVKEETRELIETLKGYGVEQREEALLKTNKALAALDQKIDVLETRIDESWERMDKAARDKARASMRALREKRTDVAEWYGSWKVSSANAWEHMKTGFADAYQALHEAWEEAEKEYADPQR